MSAQVLEIIAVLLALAALMSWINARYIGLPTTIAVMSLALVMSLVLVAAGSFAEPLRLASERFVERIDFRHALLDGMLAFLLFAGAVQIDVRQLRRQLATTSMLALLATPISAGLIALMVYPLLSVLGAQPDLIDCLLLGAVLSPTDPVAVIGMLKRVNAPARLQVQLAGESLFNDGIAAVIFLALLEARAGNDVSAHHVLALLARQGLGGAIVGVVLGFIAAFLLAGIQETGAELMVTLALAAGSYSLADHFDLSGVLAVVCAGVTLSQMRFGRPKVFAGPSPRRWGEHVDAAWELIDESLNTLLFLLIGLEVLVTPVHWRGGAAAVAAAIAVLAARLVCVLVVAWTLRVFAPKRMPDRKDIAVLTWGGLRGGLSVALALAIPEGPGRAAQVTLAYGVVIFSILVQGLSVSGLIRRLGVRGDGG